MLLTKADRDCQCFGKRQEERNGEQKPSTVLPAATPGLPSGNSSVQHLLTPCRKQQARESSPKHKRCFMEYCSSDTIKEELWNFLGLVGFIAFFLSTAAPGEHIKYLLCKINLNLGLILVSPHKTNGGVLISWLRSCLDSPTTH